MGFFKRLVTPAGEEAFVDGCRELSQGRYASALRHLEQATHLTDGAFLAGFLHLKNEQADEDTCRYIVKLTKDIDNETPIHTALLLYKARALNGLNMHTAARDILTKILRRKKDRSEDLMLALRYERALTYESLGQSKRARSDFEKIYAEDPDFEDVEKRWSAEPTPPPG